jgi:hypothetical protein
MTRWAALSHKAFPSVAKELRIETPKVRTCEVRDTSQIVLHLHVGKRQFKLYVGEGQIEELVER